jgi:hypothetical protein
MRERYSEYELMPEFETLPASSNIQSLIASGNRDENKLTNTLFFARHPELSGQKLSSGLPNYSQLSQEWVQIRNTIVRPALSSSGSSSSSGLAIGTSSNPDRPPTEGPLKGITGYTCRSGKKCWDKAKSADIVDNDAPWNKPTNRSATNYAKVLDYLNVGEPSPGNTVVKPSENPRYRQTSRSTFCNIYVHDATRMMWASIPHWIQRSRGPNEINANDTVTWLGRNANSIGWFKIETQLINWINQQANQKISLSFQGPSLPNNLIMAGQRISAGNYSDPSLLNQASFIAQQFANLGLPTAAVWKNPTGIGHVAMIRPESDGKTGKIVAGIFIPRSAQAGAKNFSNDYLVFRAASVKSGAVQFFVHE